MDDVVNLRSDARRRTLTMAELAAIAGVSPMTISRALRGDKGVGSGTRERVEALARKHGYIPAGYAGDLSAGGSNSVALILPTLNSPLFSVIAEAIKRTLERENLETSLYSCEFTFEKEYSVVKSALSRRPRAIALPGGPQNDEVRRMLEAVNIPVIEYFEHPEISLNHFVVVDFKQISTDLVHFLKAKGRRQIIVVDTWLATSWKWSGLIDAIVQACDDLAMAKPQVIAPPNAADGLAAAGKWAVEQAFHAFPRPDAFICMDDSVALGAIAQIRDMGLQIPKDVSVFGFGDQEVSRYTSPSISTVALNPSSFGVEIGKMIISAVEAKLNGWAHRQISRTCEGCIVDRESA